MRSLGHWGRAHGRQISQEGCYKSLLQAQPLSVLHGSTCDASSAQVPRLSSTALNRHSANGAAQSCA